LTWFAELKDAHALFYKAYIPLEGENDTDVPIRIARLAEIEQLIREKRWVDARQRSAQLIELGLDGLRYLQTYANAQSAKKNRL
jgi:phosphatidylinositol glycan class N